MYSTPHLVPSSRLARLKELTDRLSASALTAAESSALHSELLQLLDRIDLRVTILCLSTPHPTLVLDPDRSAVA